MSTSIYLMIEDRLYKACNAAPPSCRKRLFNDMLVIYICDTEWCVHTAEPDLEKLLYMWVHTRVQVWASITFSLLLFSPSYQRMLQCMATSPIPRDDSSGVWLHIWPITPTPKDDECEVFMLCAHSPHVFETLVHSPIPKWGIYSVQMISFMWINF